jgi:SAM-dependent methyltransferase
MNNVKRIVKKIPYLSSFSWKVYRYLSSTTFSNSKDYWEQRYSHGGSSGDGSYGQLAQFKADYINQFVNDHEISSVIEFGCGDGNQLALASYPKYIGLDVSKSAIFLCANRFSTDLSKSFFLYDPKCFVDTTGVFQCELSLSLDVIFHLVEEQVYEAYMHHLFSSATRFVIIYSSNSEKTQPAAHVRNRCFTQWIEENIKGWVLVEKTVNKFPYNNVDRSGSWSDFYVYSPKV